MRLTLSATIRLIALTLYADALPAHEFWISPEAYQIELGYPIAAENRVGEKLSGSAYPYVPRNTARFEVRLAGDVHQVVGRVGDRPALNQDLPGEGLAVAVHETTDFTLTYRKWEKFVAFTDHKDFAWAQAEHHSRGLPGTGFSEAYRRYAKSLVAIGAGEGTDHAVGLELEIVALANPYTDDLSAGLPVRVLYKGAPRADAQIELFSKPDEGIVDVSLHRTDAAGEATLPMRPGREYLVDSVVLLPVEPETADGPVWRSLWASLTFRTPAP